MPGIVRNIIADRILGLKPFDWTADGMKSRNQALAAQKLARFSAAAPKKGTKPSHPLADYSGTYNNPGYGNFVVHTKADSLFAQAGVFRLWLRHRHYDMFDPYAVNRTSGAIDTSSGPQPIKFQFATNMSGDIDALTVPFEAELKPMVFTKQLKAVAVAANDLKKYVGDYNLQGATVKVYLKNGATLFAVVPNQPEYELIPVERDKFGLKVLSGYYVQFTVTDGVAEELMFIQPNGNFKAVRK